MFGKKMIYDKCTHTYTQNIYIYIFRAQTPLPQPQPLPLLASLWTSVSHLEGAVGSICENYASSATETTKFLWLYAGCLMWSSHISDFANTNSSPVIEIKVNYFMGSLYTMNLVCSTIWEAEARKWALGNPPGVGKWKTRQVVTSTPFDQTK